MTNNTFPDRFDAGVLVGVSLVHGDVVSPEKEESEVAVLVADRVDPDVIHPAEILQFPLALAPIRGVLP